MSLRIVTFTGADDSVQPEALRTISDQYPWIEWGILLRTPMSRSSIGSPRFPSAPWLRAMLETCPLPLSAHFCGSLAREICLGNPSFVMWMHAWGIKPELFSRIQINVHGPRHLSRRVDPMFWNVMRDAMGNYEWEVILPQDDTGSAFFAGSPYSYPIGFFPIYDASHGGGLMPPVWPMGKRDVFSGYAGGLGPDNLTQELPRIIAAAHGAPIWIDMETKIRSTNDQIFDIEKVKACIDICAPFIARSTQDDI